MSINFQVIHKDTTKTPIYFTSNLNSRSTCKPTPDEFITITLMLTLTLTVTFHLLTLGSLHAYRACHGLLSLLTLVVIAQAVFLLERGDRYTQTDKLRDATGHSTNATATRVRRGYVTSSERQLEVGRYFVVSERRPWRRWRHRVVGRWRRGRAEHGSCLALRATLQVLQTNSCTQHLASIRSNWPPWNASAPQYTVTIDSQPRASARRRWGQTRVLLQENLKICRKMGRNETSLRVLEEQLFYTWLNI